MEEYYRVTISKDRLIAKLDLILTLENDFTIERNEIINFLSKEKIIYGINEDLINKISEDPRSINYPVIIAEGNAQKDGIDAYLLNEVRHDKSEGREKFNFRKVLEIPSVSSGQILATIVPPTPGSDGTDVFGNKIASKNGKPIKIRPGKNVILNGTSFYSTSEGQLSLTNKMISVNPIFEVNGDLDLKTGNIEFIGNVIVRGNVPSGYEIKAGGDVTIYGLVEGVTIKAEGNIIVSGGVTGGNKAFLTAGGNIQAAYINQSFLQAGQDIIISNYILHSNVQAGNSIQCKSALVIGGILKARNDIHVKEVGNHLYTKTDLQATIDSSFDERERELQAEKSKLIESFEKLSSIEQRIQEIEKRTGNLSTEQRTIILKQRSTKYHINEQLTKVNDELEQIKEERNEKIISTIYIYETIHPNTTLHFGKYAMQIQQKHSAVKFSFLNGEIVSDPIR
ncbi:DUF342 domain-containing protein [Cytobacillus dafuensis]|uniref:DUF342 domain-containing protein n=1 Tax=Cytobacillus dafuensis TaxID=1742359 RepID=A0A5B8Z3X1_CYTDA|nr:FapA family protein [Cytobacillus dafuensis]QED47567.1 DUF342 domain-containing protein [Cytobacillus dafuensis]